MASEDSDELVPGFPSVHGLRDLENVCETGIRQVMTSGDRLDAVSELLKVESLCGFERMPSEERDDRLQ